MVVTGDGLRGTIGGGALEWRVIQQARAILALPPGSWRVQDYPLGPLLGQCCGGRVRVLLERLDAGAIQWIQDFQQGEAIVARLGTDAITRRHAGTKKPEGKEFLEPIETTGFPLILFGAGHVGRAIADRIPGLPLQLAWFDSREDAADWPGVLHAQEAEMVGCARTAPADAAILIVTHDHGLDYRLTAAALEGHAGFVGLIGSATKRARFLSRLSKEDIDASRLTCPIGLPGVTGKEPAVIAIAALAQILSLGGSGA
jgi:xanthine dehydrogenase accessory factor